MPSESATQEESRSLQSSQSKRATLEILRKKKRKTKSLDLMVNDEAYTFTFRAIGALEYDRLVTDAPPTIDQRSQGSSYNINVFGPSLMAVVVVDPRMSKDEWDEIWRSPDWNRGELMTLFSEAVEVCNATLSVGPTEPA